MGKAKMTLLHYLVSTKETREVAQEQLDLLVARNYEDLASLILHAFCGKKLRRKEYRSANVNFARREIDVYYGGVQRNGRVFNYGHLCVGLAEDFDRKKNKIKVVIFNHRRPCSQNGNNKAFLVEGEQPAT